MKDAPAREQTDTEADAAGHGLRVPFSGDETPHVSADETPRADAVRRRLARLVAAKLALDLLFVGAFALYTHAVTFRRGFDGELEHADGRGARGWVVDLDRPGEAVEVQLFVDGHFAAAAVAREPRPGDPPGSSAERARRVFAFEFGREQDGGHEARVYAVREGRGGARRTLQQVGGARRFDRQ
jgi:hypothetical protein